MGGGVIQLPFGFHHPSDNVAVVQETVRSIWIQEFLYYSFLWSGSLYSVLFTALSVRRGMWPLKKICSSYLQRLSLILDNLVEPGINTEKKVN